MYPVPTEAATQGRTDLYIGTWLKGSGRRREDVVLATKVSGRGQDWGGWGGGGRSGCRGCDARLTSQ